MKIKSLLIVSFIMLLFSDFTVAQYSLEIEISAIKSDKGRVMLQVFNEKQNVITQEMSVIQNNKCQFSIKDLNPGKYAVRYFHDENLSGVMETNLVGKPTEGYGFSNNVTGKFRAPPFEKWLVEIKSDTKISLKPTY